MWENSFPSNYAGSANKQLMIMKKLQDIPT